MNKKQILRKIGNVLGKLIVIGMFLGLGYSFMQKPSNPLDLSRNAKIVYDDGTVEKVKITPNNFDSRR